MPVRSSIFFAILVTVLLPLSGAVFASEPDPLDLQWKSPGGSAVGSVPLGNGDLGLNVWVESNGDLMLLIGKTDSFDEFNRLLKIGRVRIRTTPALFRPGQTFSQTLHPREGSVTLESGGISVRVWVDANHPLAQVDLTSITPVNVQLLAENWRNQSGPLPAGAATSAAYNRPDKMWVNADTKLATANGDIGWCHHNIESQWAKNLELTGLGGEITKMKDPVSNRSFGALIHATSATAVSDTELKTPAATTAFSARILSLTTTAESVDAWRSKAEAAFEEAERTPSEIRFSAHQAWWREFWNRSWLEVSGSPAAERVSRAYAYQRFVSACSGRGPLPIKFNGSIFTVEGPNPDFRAWGGAYWWQNTRCVYWPMLYSGDYDMMAPLFRMYLDALPLRKAATKAYYGHEGAFFPETIYFWGNYTDGNYGLDRTGKPAGLADNLFIRRYWQGGIELVAMMLDYHDATGDAVFRDRTLLPIAREIITFSDQHWPRENGKIHISPAQALETWQDATNPTPEIAGLRHVLPRLLALKVDAATKAAWTKTLADLPPIPTRDVNGKLRLLPAEIFSRKGNIENPELYAVFPYLFHTCLEDPKDAEPGLEAWRVRLNTEDKGWQQNCIQAALLGLTSQAKAMVEGRAGNIASGYRFPGFFGPNYDWTPEQCHGTNMMTALQRMLMQCQGDRIVLLPAWPKEWGGSFKLHAPKNTIISGRIENGEVMDLAVTPPARRKDVEIRSAK